MRPRRTAGRLAVLLASALSVTLVGSPATAQDRVAGRAEAGTEAGPEGGHEGRALILAHRGASGYRPEHTLAAYRLAIALGTDYIEPDLVSTRDGVLVARHENEISGTTDVAEHREFADRRTTKVVDGASLTGWFTEDFTLAELKTLRAKERIPDVRPQNARYDGQFEVPTLQEVVNLARRESRRRGRTIGIYPELKHPTYFDSIGLSLEEPLARTLRRNGMAHEKAPVFVQSFETGSLRDLDELVEVPLVQLLSDRGAPYDLVSAGDSRTYADLVTPVGLREIATYADGIGAEKKRIVPRTADDSLGETTTLVRDAHREGLVVHAYTFRSENRYLPQELRRGSDPRAYGDAVAEYELFFRLGVDGVFTDHPDDALVARAGLRDEEAA